MCGARYEESIEKNKRVNIRVSHDWMKVCFNPLKLSLSRSVAWVGQVYPTIQICSHVWVLLLCTFCQKTMSSLKLLWFPCVISQVTNAQLEALRIENRHLRDTALNEQLTVS